MLRNPQLVLCPNALITMPNCKMAKAETHREIG